MPDATPGREWGRLKGPRGLLRRRVEGMGGGTAAICSSQPPAGWLVVQEGKLQRKVGQRVGVGVQREGCCEALVVARL